MCRSTPAESANSSGDTPGLRSDIGARRRSPGISWVLMNVPEELRYSAEHEWIRTDGAQITVGITDYAQDALGDIVFIQVPEVGALLEAGSMMGEIESTKSVSEIYAPIAGTVTEVNTNLEDSPEMLNSDPYGEGWIVVMEPATPSDLDGLLDQTEYRALTEE